MALVTQFEVVRLVSLRLDGGVTFFTPEPLLEVHRMDDHPFVSQRHQVLPGQTRIRMTSNARLLNEQRVCDARVMTLAAELAGMAHHTVVGARVPAQFPVGLYEVDGMRHIDFVAVLAVLRRMADAAVLLHLGVLLAVSRPPFLFLFMILRHRLLRHVAVRTELLLVTHET